MNSSAIAESYRDQSQQADGQTDTPTSTSGLTLRLAQRHLCQLLLSRATRADGVDVFE